MSYNIKIEAYEGSISLLYKLIEDNKIDIYDIPISDVTEQYLSYISDKKNFNMKITVDFIYMAATLLEIKSKMLLPSKEKNDTFKDPREDLVKKLLEYKQFKEISVKLEELKFEFEKSYPSNQVFIKKQVIAPMEESLDSLVSAYTNVLKTYTKNNPSIEKIINIEKKDRDDFTIRDGMIYIKTFLEVKKHINFESIFENMESLNKEKIIILFLSILELIKDKKLIFYQSDNFNDIILKKL